MKRLMSVVLSVVVVLMMCGGAMAEECFNAQGSALVPNIIYVYNNAKNYVYPYITISNITDKEVQCKVTVFDHDGVDVTSLGSVLSGGSSLVTISHGVGDIDLPAYSTRAYSLQPSGGKKVIYGHAIIEWKSADAKLRRALIGGVNRHRLCGTSRSDSERLINDGNPF